MDKKSIHINFQLDASTIHLWSADLNCTIKQEKNYFSLLSLDEKEKAAKFKFKRDASQYIIAKGILRTLLGKYLLLSPDNLAFTYSKYGKPSLIDYNHLQFNISHAGDKAIFAFTKDVTIGADIELVKKIDVAKLAGRFFSKNESDYIFQTPVDNWENLFYKCWTRKEAFIKAHGEGLSLPLDGFEVSLDDKEPPKIKSIKWKPNSADDWQLFTFIPFESYFGAVVSRSKNKQLKSFDWTH